MRIAIDCRKIGDFGIGTYIRGLLSGLAGIGGDDCFVLLVPRQMRGLVPHSDRFDLVEESSPHYSVRELLALGQAIDRSGADLFHAPHYVVPFTSCPFVVTIHDLIHFRTKRGNPAAAAYARWMIGRAVRGSRAIATVSSAVAEEIRGVWGEAAEKIEVIPPAVEAIFFGGPAGDAEILARLGLREGSYFLAAGNDKPHKNLDRLVSAFQSVRTGRGPDLVIAGSAPVRFASVDGVHVAGRVGQNELAALYRSALALVLPSLQEGFGLPAAEAMAAGCAVIASDIPPLREVTGGAALMIDPRSVESIAGAMREVREESVRSALIARGRARAESMTCDVVAEKTSAMYHRAGGAR